MSRSSPAKVNRAWARFNRSRRALERLMRPYLIARSRWCLLDEPLSADHRKIDSTIQEMRELARSITPIWGTIVAARHPAPAGWTEGIDGMADEDEYLPEYLGNSDRIFTELVELYAMHCRFVLRLMRLTLPPHLTR